MHFKLDENANPRWRVILEDAGHTVSTVVEEHLQGESDNTIAAVCRSINICLITLDLDFSQTKAYPPSLYPGLILLRHPKPTLRSMEQLIR